MDKSTSLFAHKIGAPLLTIILGFLIGACQSSEQAMDEETHREIVEAWHEDRIASLKEPDGWLKVAGLFWLDEGVNTFGSKSGLDVRFPENTVPEESGHFEVRGDSVKLELQEDLDIRLENGESFDGGVVFTPDTSLTLEYERLTWFILQRDDLIGIRLFDSESPFYTGFQGIERYEVDKKWRVEAEFVHHEEQQTINVTNILGQTNPDDSSGKLVFTIDDEEYSLAVLDRDDQFFIPFADQTNRRDTYGSGRFIYTDTPDEDGKVTIDFNKAYNPPCAINPYTTCPLPPEPNRLDLSITAGEKDYPLQEITSR